MDSDKKAAVDEKTGVCRLPACVSAVISVVCCFLVQCTLGFSYTYGNINPYVTSYLRNMTRDGDDVNFGTTLWISETRNISNYVTMPVMGLLSTRIPCRLYLLIGVVATAVSFFGTYSSLQTSYPLTIVTYGVVGGVSNAVLYPGCLNIAIRWLPDRRGVVTGLVLTGYGVGSVAWTQLTTWYINPHNQQPDLRVAQDLYFTQPSVLSKVPSCFLLCGAVFTALQLLSVVLLCPPPPAQQRAFVVLDASTEKAKLLTDSLRDWESSLARETQKTYGTGTEDRQQPPTAQHPSHQGDYTWREVVKSRVFWTLWAMMALTQMGTALFSNLFKAYGETFIADDHFLTVVASLGSVFNAAGRPGWGLLADRLGPRIVAMVAQCVLASLVVTLMTCERTGRWPFLVWVCAIYLTMCGTFTMVPTLVFGLFGPRFFNVNMGLMDTNGVFSAVMVAALAPLLKTAFGWHSVFFLAFATIFVGVLLNTSVSLKCGDSIPPAMYKDLSLASSQA